MSFNDPYQAYAEGSVYSGNPLGLVVALYEGTIQNIERARHCLATGDAMARSKAVNKAMELLTQLLVSLDHERGGEISANLKRLYSYVQCRLLDGHTQRVEAPMREAQRLLETMLEGWREAATKTDVSETHLRGVEHFGSEPDYPEMSYGFFNEPAELACAVSAVF